MIKTKKQKYLGKLIFSATGLRKMANALQKKNKTKGDVKVKCYIEKFKYKYDGEIYKTIGIDIKGKKHDK